MTAHEQFQENLALYAAGALEREEAQELELHLAECSTCRQELESLQEAAAQIALAVKPVRPPDDFRQQLVARFVNRPAAGVAQDAGPIQFPARQLPKRGVWFWIPAFAAFLLAVALGMIGVQNRRLTAENRELESKLAVNQQALDNAKRLIHAFTAPDAQRVSLVTAGVSVRPEAKAVYSPQEGNLVLLADHLSPLPAHKVYELWLLPANGSQPIPAGTFTPNERGSAGLVLSQFGSGMTAKGFAVTVENEPGSPTPTLPIVISGTI